MSRSVGKCHGAAAKRARQLTTGITLEPLIIQSAKAKKGLCGLDLNRSSDLVALTRSVLAQCEERVSRLRGYEQLSASEVVNILDEISDLVCQVSDPSELILSVVSDNSMTTAAELAVREIQEAIVALNQDPMLEQATRWAYERQKELSLEEASVAKQLLVEFDHQGASLPASAKEEHANLQSQLYEAMETFRQVSESPKEGRKVEIGPEVLPPQIARTLPRTIRGNVIVNTADRHLVHQILSNAGDEAVRKQFSYNNQQSTLEATERMLQARHAVATHLGFPSYSHYHSWHRSLKTPEEIFEFLDSLHSQLQTKVNSEIALLAREKQRHIGSNQIYAWDLKYYCSKLDPANKTSRNPYLGSAAASRKVSATMEEYFTLENVLRAAQHMWRSLFGVRMEIVRGNECELWHPLVFKVEFYDETKGNDYLGNAFFDLVAREGKPGSANFPIRLRSRRALPSSALLTHIQAHSNRAGAMTGRDLALARGSEALFSNKPVLVPFDDVRVFFHELGHMTQSILCKNELQHFSGTRGFMDHIETPSQVWERFASDYRFVRLFAYHYQTGELLSEDAFNQHISGHGMFAGLKTNQQIILAALDQKLHSGPFTSSADVCREVISKYASVPHHPEDMMHAGFRHLQGYGSVYYSYLFCGVKASQIYANVFDADPLSRQAGQFYRDQFLSLGGAGDPTQLLLTLTGKRPDPSYFVQDICSGKL